MVFGEYLINGSTDFQQTFGIFGKLSIISFDIKKLKIDHFLLPW